MNIETSTVTKNRNEYWVENVEDMIIKVNATQVEKVLKSVDGVEEDEIVILLATIKKSRIIASITKSTAYKKANDEVATRAIIQLLGYYPIENLIGIFEEMKYYQIKQVLESENPIRDLELYI